MTRARLLAAIAIPVVLVVAILITFFNSRAREVLVAPTTISSTTVAPTSTTNGAPPELSFGGEDWDAIVRELFAYRDYLYANPQPELLANIYDKRCPCYAQELQRLRLLRQRGAHYEGKGSRVKKVEFFARASRDSRRVQLHVWSSTQAQAVVDKNGRVIERINPMPEARYVYLLQLGNDRRWRIYYFFSSSVADRS